ncbi:MAG: uroporphyrinogen-III synthase [Alphaproteobacteria bacterium]|nr:MAG: uroporphyrinogen-III synthase [Alphaproteobacteria bacterium]
MTPTLVLTRPEAQSRALAREIGPGVRVIVSPVLEIAAAGPPPTLDGSAAVILTSASAAPFCPGLAGVSAYCVGAKTAHAAREKGARVHLAARDADDLVARLLAARADVPQPLVHLRGTHARGDIAARLEAGGISCKEAVIYDQRPLPLTDEARAALSGTDPAVLPLYSPRSARLVAEGLDEVGPAVRVLALSPAVAQAWEGATGHAAQTIPAPDGKEMLAAIRAALRA